MAQQLSSLQSDVRVSYGNDALMPNLPDSTSSLDSLAKEDGLGLDGLGFIHPESFNQANTQNQGRRHAHSDTEQFRIMNDYHPDMNYILSLSSFPLSLLPQWFLLTLAPSLTEACRHDQVG